MTDNLRGGAPGAVGKNILHSVGRGQFVLSTENPIGQSSVGDRSGDSVERVDEAPPPIDVTSQRINIGKQKFSKICDILPQKDSSGALLELLPQVRYKNEQKLPLNNYGAGPFCKFNIPSNFNVSGVYAIVVNGDVKYIGECQNLSSRYNMGYGNMSPRNCFVGGQETNCRINNLILLAAKFGAPISLWFLETERYKEIEIELRSALPLGWNRV
jgi:hypothetical protein